MSISKSNPDVSSLLKYDVEAAIDEIENTEDLSKLKFSLTTLAESKTVRVGIDGQIQVIGTESEREEILKNGQDGIPELVHVIYSQLYPEFFMLTKSVNVPCPPPTISKISKPSNNEINSDDESLKNTISVEPSLENTTDTEISNESIQDDVIEPKDSTKTIEKLNGVDKIDNGLEQNSTNAVVSLEDMTLEQLNMQYTKLTEEYNKNPKNDILTEITKISKLIENKKK